MAMASVAEARFDAEVRPDIAAMRARTSYPRRSRSATATRLGGSSAATERPSRHGGPTAALTAADPYPMIRPLPARRSLLRRMARQPNPVRLTRRGRLAAGSLLVICLLAGLAAIWLAVARGASAVSGSPAPGAVRGGMAKVMVRPGQTLWGIAEREDPSADPRVVIGEIIEVNELRGMTIQPGQVLLVPRS